MSDTQKFVKAAYVAASFHKDQRRDHGIPYVNHCLEVANTVADYTNDVNTLCAAALHDTIEDTSMTEEGIQQEFGSDVLLLVKQLTNDYPDSLEYTEKMLAVAKHAKEITDSRAQLIKLCDRLCNLHDCEAWKPKRIAKYILNTGVLIQNLPIRFEDRQSYWYNQLLAEIYEQLEAIVKIDGVHGFLTSLSGDLNEMGI